MAHRLLLLNALFARFSVTAAAKEGGGAIPKICEPDNQWESNFHNGCGADDPCRS
jgi:hypothetical protein